MGARANSAAPPIVSGVLGSVGQPLDATTRTSMESRFGHDFSRVRVYTNSTAAASASTINARAYTVGHQIVFGNQQFAPDTAHGRFLLAHELAHVVQQGSAPSKTSDNISIEPANTASELEAERVATEVASGDSRTSSVRRLSVKPVSSASGGTVQRQLITPLAPGGGFGGLMDRDRAAAAAAGTPSGARPGSAMICSKRLEAPGIGLIANHAYIDDTGRGDCHGGGLLNNYAVQTLVSGSFFQGCAAKTDRSTDPQTYTPNVKPCDPKPGVTNVHACLRDAFTAYSDPSEYSNNPVRRPWGPNSNTFAATLARTCCADSTSIGLGWVPGWDHDPAKPCPVETAPAPGGPAPAPGVTPPGPAAPAPAPSATAAPAAEAGTEGTAT